MSETIVPAKKIFLQHVPQYAFSTFAKQVYSSCQYSHNLQKSCSRVNIQSMALLSGLDTHYLQEVGPDNFPSFSIISLFINWNYHLKLIVFEVFLLFRCPSYLKYKNHKENSVLFEVPNSPHRTSSLQRRDKSMTKLRNISKGNSYMWTFIIKRTLHRYNVYWLKNNCFVCIQKIFDGNDRVTRCMLGSWHTEHHFPIYTSLLGFIPVPAIS